MSEAEGAVLLGCLAEIKQQVPVLQPVVLSRAGHAQPAHLEDTLRSLLCAGSKRPVCLCSLETAEEGAQGFMECAELGLVKGTLFGGAVVGLD